MSRLHFFMWLHISSYLSYIPPFNSNTLQISNVSRSNSIAKIKLARHLTYFSSEELKKYVKHIFIETRTIPLSIMLKMFTKTYTLREDWNSLPERMCANCFPNKSISWTRVEKIPKPGLRSKYDVYCFIRSLEKSQLDVIVRDYISKYSIRFY
mgnify:CR=1 FL=1